MINGVIRSLQRRDQRRDQEPAGRGRGPGGRARVGRGRRMRAAPVRVLRDAAPHRGSNDRCALCGAAVILYRPGGAVEVADGEEGDPLEPAADEQQLREVEHLRRRAPPATRSPSCLLAAAQDDENGSRTQSMRVSSWQPNICLRLTRMVKTVERKKSG